MLSSTDIIKKSAHGLPSVSVVIPMRNEERWIGQCLDAVVTQTYPSHLIEIIVVDADSQDGSRVIVNDYRGRNARVTLHSNPAGTIPAGLNIGIRAARGEVIARVDARTLLAPDYLETAVDLLASTCAHNVGGPVRCVTLTRRGRALALAWGSSFGLGGASTRYGETTECWTDTVYLGVYPRKVFEAIGLYDENILQDEDCELNYRLRSCGGRIFMSPRLRSNYLNSPSLLRLAWKNLLFGYSKVQVCQKYPRMMSWRHLIPPLFVAGLLFGPLFVKVHGLFGAAWLIGVGSYLAACLGVASRYLLQGQGSTAMLLPVIFPILHLSWGTGFLAGTVRFLLRWFRYEPPPPPSLHTSASPIRREVGCVIRVKS